MQSSLSCSHRGRIGFSFQQNTNPAWAYPQRRVQSPLFLILRSTRPYTSPASSSSSLRHFSYSTNGARSFRDWIELIGEAVSTAFPIWVALGCLLGLIKPSSFSWVQPKWTIVGITLTILGMGMTLTLDDLRGALAMPKQLLSGFLLEYSARFVGHINRKPMRHHIL